MKNLGYFTLPTESGDKTLHFSWNFIDTLKEVSGMEITEWGKTLNSKNPSEQIQAMTEMVFSGMAAHTLESGEDIDYNIYQVKNWVMAALTADEKLATDMSAVFSTAMENMMGKKMQGTNLQKAKKKR